MFDFIPAGTPIDNPLPWARFLIPIACYLILFVILFVPKTGDRIVKFFREKFPATPSSSGKMADLIAQQELHAKLLEDIARDNAQIKAALAKLLTPKE